MNIKDNKFRKCLKKLTEKALSLYVLSIDKNITPKDYISISLFKFDKEVEKIKEFKVCLDIMSKDPKVSELNGKLVGTKKTKAIIKNEKECLLAFVKYFYLKNENFDDSLFEKHYKSFEELFYSDTLRFKESVRLHNFESESDEIILGNDIKIKKIFQFQNDEQKIQEMKYNPYSQFSKSDFVVERLLSEKKIVGENKVNNIKIIKTDDQFDLVAKSLRILKSSAVFRSVRVKNEMLTFHPIQGISTITSFGESIVLGEKCIITKKDEEYFKKVFNELENEKDKRFRLASDRLSFGMERKRLEDRLIDYMIGLEALYLPDGNQELVFRISVRIARTLNTEFEKRFNCFRFVKKMYDIRSKIIHGDKYELKEKDIVEVEDILRQSILIWLLDDKKKFFAIEKIEGKEKCGALNRIFFE